MALSSAGLTTKTRWAAGLFALVLALPASAARAESECAPVKSTVEMTIAPCPNGEPTTCAYGQVSGQGLNGGTFFIVTGGQIEGVIQRFEGLFLVFTDEGSTLTFTTTGKLNTNTGRFVQTFDLQGGDDQSVHFVSTGVATGTGFSGDFRGILCGA